MDLPANPFKRAIKAGKPQIGLWLSLSSHYSAEVCAGSGFDWLLLDSEHSPNELDMVLCQLQAIAPYPTHPVVRIPWNDTVTIKRVLDIGAQTLLIPYVSSAEEARAAVSATRYPPQGVRGVGGTTRATRFGRIKDYAKRAHEELCVLVQVETQAALDSLEAIANVDANWGSPKTSATLTWPTSLALMKPGANVHMTTYSRYQTRNATVAGTAKPR